jgi:hypothetical protein
VRGGIGMSAMETADSYSPLIAQLNAGWRVIECSDQQQWIRQRRGSPKKARRDDWRGHSYCRTAEALRRCTRDYVGAIEPTAAVILAALPPLIRAAAAGGPAAAFVQRRFNTNEKRARPLT